MRFSELEFSAKTLRSSAAFGGRIQRPPPRCVRSAHRRELGRMPSETREKLQKYRMSRRNSGDFGCILMSAAHGWFAKLASFPNGSCWCFEFCGGILWDSSVRFAFILTSVGLERLFVLLDACGAWTNETHKSLRGEAPTPLALPYPLGTSTWKRMDAERDKGEVAKINVVQVFCGGNLATSAVSCNNVCSVRIIPKIGIISKRWVVAKVLNFAAVFSRAFVLLDACGAWARVIIPIVDRFISSF